MTDTAIQILELPDELRDLVLGYVAPSDLRNVCLAGRSIYSAAAAFLWKHVVLVDDWTLYSGPPDYQKWGERGCGDPDEHDDTPIIRRLLVLARNPLIASKVQKLTHRCHLPTPGIFNELPRMFFHAQTLSQDPRTRRLVHLAIQNMVNLQTLRIVFGHWHLTKALLEGFLDPARPRRVPLRKLWLESVSLDNAEIDFGNNMDLSGLKSIRIRRLRAHNTNDVTMSFPEFQLNRGGHPMNMHNGAGGYYQTTVSFGELPGPHRGRIHDVEALVKIAEGFDDHIYDALPEAKEFIEQSIRNHPIPTSRSGRTSAIPFIRILQMSTQSLTNLNLDWVLWRRLDSSKSPEDELKAVEMIDLLSKLRFPNLRAFQMRNAVVQPTKLPDGNYLLDPNNYGATPFLDFIEAHSKLQCLAWPMDRFYSLRRVPAIVAYRTREVVAHLGRTLLDLRVDSYYEQQGEPMTDESTTSSGLEAKARRRRFIAEFAPQLMKLKQIKMEGGIPRDEKRETIRALHYCPLEKLVLIGVSCPIGNTWGLNAEDLKRIDEGEHEYPGVLEEEHKDCLLSLTYGAPTVSRDFRFEPAYGWPPGPPMMYTIAAHHASTITELKFCGYNGSPILSQSTPITQSLLSHLRCFHNLKQLVLSMWILTYFNHEDRDDEIISSWLNTRSSSSTALVVVTPAGASPNPSPTSSLEAPPLVAPTVAPNTPPDGPAPEFDRWAVLLRTKFSPSALAYRVAADIGPYLSEQAKENPGGVRVRASFCLGTSTGDIFDLDLRIGRGDQVLEFVGPREEGEKGRWWDKLEARRWF
ncbi:uncharacterized protein BDZ99DRAFT_431173 [Mytilinidion resinicola]|uniref:F-box domain-containing protein n=1 Tax=Mytilinidion resinicola TaxID=574789 RepID=A0A6A6Z8V8_9PEZI|nr:uncharacterized protein BDZ99DRAFT_431173 [Mytilinidion resinicola]KAF2817238.1 hypothetical protein BDZ99DRAFT_431173 [Mytilinidion resinicola]